MAPREDNSFSFLATACIIAILAAIGIGIWRHMNSNDRKNEARMREFVLGISSGNGCEALKNKE